MAEKKKLSPEEPEIKEAPEEKEKKKMGRPRIEIDKKNFEYLVSCGCTLKMIAGYFALNLGSCSEDTIERWCKREYGRTFAEVCHLRKEGGKCKVLMKQMDIALAGSEKMLIWLGKVMCGQSETRSSLSSDEEKQSRLYEVLDADDDDLEEGDDIE